MIGYAQNNPYMYGSPSVPYLPDFRPVQPAQQQVQNNVQWIYVTGLEGAKGQIAQPGQTLWMMDNSDPVIYVKAVDAVGSVTLRAFRMDEIDTATQVGSSVSYATKRDLDGVAERIKALEDIVGGVNT